VKLFETLPGGGLVLGKSIAISEHLAEQRLAICFDAPARLACHDLVGKGKAQVLLEVPFETRLLLGREGIGDRDRILPALIDADDRIERTLCALLDAGRDHTGVTWPNW
jgi:hypothetical protein